MDDAELRAKLTDQYSLLAEACTRDCLVNNGKAMFVVGGGKNPIAELVPVSGANFSELMHNIDAQVVWALGRAEAVVPPGESGAPDVAGAMAALGRADVPIEDEDNMFGVISVEALSRLFLVGGYDNGDYVDLRLPNGRARRVYRSLGVNWIKTRALTDNCFLFHRNAIGHAANIQAAVVTPTGITLQACTTLLQPIGVVRMAFEMPVTTEAMPA